MNPERGRQESDAGAAAARAEGGWDLERFARAWPVLLGVGVYTILLTLVFERIGRGGYGDVDRYLRLAQDTSADVGSPWRFRLLTPLVARLLSHVLHIELITAFRLFNGAVLTLSAALLVRLLRQINYGAGASLIGVALYVLSYGYTANVGAGALVDPVLYLTGISTLLILASARQNTLSTARSILVGFVLFLGVINKETALLFLAGVYFALEDGTAPGRRRALGLTAATGLPAIAAFAIVRLLFAASGEGYLKHYTPERLTDTVRYWLHGPGMGFYYCFGFLWPLLFLSRSNWPPFARRLVPLIVLLLPLNLLATDVARTMSAALPIVILAALASYRPPQRWPTIALCLAVYWGAMALPELLDPGWQRKMARAAFSLAGLGVVWLVEAGRKSHSRTAPGSRPSSRPSRR